MNLVQRNPRYWMRLTRLSVVALAAGLVGGIAGYVLLASAVYAHNPRSRMERRVVAFFGEVCK